MDLLGLPRLLEHLQARSMRASVTAIEHHAASPMTQRVTTLSHQGASNRLHGQTHRHCGLKCLTWVMHSVEEGGAWELK